MCPQEQSGKLSTTLSNNQKLILLHTLGYDYSAKPFRNYFMTGKDTTDYPDIVFLIDLGFIKYAGPYQNEEAFQVTELGEEVAYELYKSTYPEPTRSQKRYKEYLKYAECRDISFSDYLKKEKEIKVWRQSLS